MRQVVIDTNVGSLAIKQRPPAEELLCEIVEAQTDITFVTTLAPPTQCWEEPALQPLRADLNADPTTGHGHRPK